MEEGSEMKKQMDEGGFVKIFREEGTTRMV